MFFFATKASSILFTVAISLLVLDSNNGISLLLNHPTSSVFANSESTNNTLVVTHGIASGDVTNDSAVVWSRSNQEAQMHVEYDTNSNFTQPKSMNAATLTNQTTDYIAYVKLERLNSDTLYYYRVWFSNKSDSLNSGTLTGSFRTAPDPSFSSTKPLSFIFAEISEVRSIVVKLIMEDTLSSKK